MEWKVCKYLYDGLRLVLAARAFFTPLLPFLPEPFAEVAAVRVLRGLVFGVLGPLMVKCSPPDFFTIWRILMRCSEMARGVGAGWSLAVVG